MNQFQSGSNGSPCTRRTFLIGAGTVGIAGTTGSAFAASEEPTPTVITPAVDEFEDNYTGQFLTIRDDEPGEEGDIEAVRGACGELPWPEGETQQRVGQLTDRRSDSPIAVRLPVFLDQRRNPDTDDALYIISDASACNSAYVTLTLAPIELRSITGGESGPGVTEEDDSDFTDVDGSGFGFLAGVAGAAIALLTRALLDRE